MHIRGFYVVATDPDTKLPHMDRVKFTYTYVVNGKEDDDFKWVKLREIYGDENEAQFVGCLYEMMLTNMENVTNIHGTPVIQGDDLLNRSPKKRV